RNIRNQRWLLSRRRRCLHRERFARASLALPLPEIPEGRSRRDIFWFRFFFLFLRRKTQPALPPGIGVRVTLRLLRHHAVFESRDHSQQLAGFKWLHDVSVGLDPARFFRFER